MNHANIFILFIFFVHLLIVCLLFEYQTSNIRAMTKDDNFNIESLMETNLDYKDGD